MIARVFASEFGMFTALRIRAIPRQHARIDWADFKPTSPCASAVDAPRGAAR